MRLLALKEGWSACTAETHAIEADEAAESVRFFSNLFWVPKRRSNRVDIGFRCLTLSVYQTVRRCKMPKSGLVGGIAHIW